MSLLDSITGIFGNDKKTGTLVDAVKDGKIDANDIKNIAMNELDSDGDGKLNQADLDVNQDGKVDLADLDAAKEKFPKIQ